MTIAKTAKNRFTHCIVDCPTLITPAPRQAGGGKINRPNGIIALLVTPAPRSQCTGTSTSFALQADGLSGNATMR
jgi:hypothetical protein